MAVFSNRTLSFAEESLRVIERTEMAYSALARLQLSRDAKLKVTNNMRYDFFDCDERLLMEDMNELAVLVKKIEQQRNCYHLAFQTIKNHLPNLVGEYRFAAEEGSHELAEKYADMKTVLDAIQKMDIKRFNQMQGAQDKDGVCRNSGIARMVATRYKDNLLAERLATMPTGMSEFGKKAIKDIFEQRMDEMVKEHPDIGKQYAESQEFLASLYETMKNFDEIIRILDEQIATIYLIMSSPSPQGFPMVAKIRYLFEKEAELEEKNLGIMMQNQKKNNVLEMRSRIVDDSLSRMQEARYRGKIAYEKHSEKVKKGANVVFTVLDVVSVACMLIAPPVGAAVGATTKFAIQVARNKRTLETVLKMAKFIGRAKKKIEVLDKINSRTSIKSINNMRKAYGFYKNHLKKTIEKAKQLMPEAPASGMEFAPAYSQ